METRNIKYTSAALKQLDKFKEDQVKILEDLIVENKKFPGVDFIEITASDIQDQARKFTYQKTTLKVQAKYLLIYIYFIMGICLMLSGFLYQDIINIWKNEPRQVLLILMGLTMTLISGVLHYYIKYRERARYDQQREYLEYLNSEKIYYEELRKNLQEERNKSIHNIS